MTLHTLRRKAYSLSQVPSPSPRLRVLFDDYRRFKAAYDHMAAFEPENEVGLAMLLSDLQPVEHQLASLLQKVESAPGRSMNADRAVAAGERRARKGGTRGRRH